MSSLTGAGPWIFAFDGQGAFKPGFGRQFLGNHEFNRRFDEVSAISGMDLAELSWGRTSVHTARRNGDLQITLFAQCWALAHSVVQRAGRAPSFVMGHSLGELSALVFSGALSLESGVRLIRLRGELMEKAGREQPQDLLILFCGEEQRIAQLIADHGNPRIHISNLNSSDQTCVAGELEDLRRFSGWLGNQAGIRSQLFGAGIGFHSPLLDGIDTAFREAIAGLALRTPSIPIYFLEANRCVSDPAEIRTYLLSQLTEQVRWKQAIRKITQSEAAGTPSFCEIGPSRILKALIQRDAPLASVTHCAEYMA